MAASDPTPYVATPTGALQGVAAFSWDGSAWQPSGRAGPDAATSTGVLQGVAPFSWSGSAWTPAGVARPGVATPSGVLDGVAVYTWSGSAWTPTGGTATPSTPSGALRGVAAFSWDGAAWQPAGQARPSVATPYGVLDGVAFFNWSGTTWAAGAAVPSGATLNLSFLSGTLDPSLTFTRASTATYFDATGTVQTAATNAPRFDYDPVTHVLRGLLIEEARTNLLLNSATLGTQSVAVTAQAYVLSFYGTGTATLSGASTAGPLVGTGAFPTRVSLTFTPTAGTLTLTVTGSVLNAQLEAGSFNTSWIPTTAAAVTRAMDVCTIPPAGWFVSPGGSWAAEFVSINPLVAASYRRIVTVDVAASVGIITLDTASLLGQYDGAASMFTASAVTVSAVAKGATTWTSGTAKACLNGGAVASSAALTGGYSGVLANNVRFLSNATPAEGMSGYIRRVRYWPRVLLDAELQSVTT